MYGVDVFSALIGYSLVKEKGVVSGNMKTKFKDMLSQLEGLEEKMCIAYGYAEEKILSSSEPPKTKSDGDVASEHTNPVDGCRTSDCCSSNDGTSQQADCEEYRRYIKKNDSHESRCVCTGRGAEISNYEEELIKINDDFVNILQKNNLVELIEGL